MVRKLGKRIKDGFRRVWSPSQILFSISLATFFFFMAIISSLFLVGVEGMQMIYFWVASGVFLLMALLTLLRIKIEPDKDGLILKKLDRIIDILGGNDMAKNGNKKNDEKITITRAEFHTLVKRAAQPIKKVTESDSASGETLGSRHSDDYTEKNTH